MNRLDPRTFAAFKRGDHGAFQDIYQQYKSLLYIIILSYVRHEPTAEDLLQDTFIKIYQKGHTVKQPEAFQAWAVMIAKRTALNELKRRKEEVMSDEAALHLVASEERSLFQTWHRGLTDEENLIIAYKIVYDLGFEEIATLQDASLSHVYKIYQLAMEKLKVIYQTHEKNK